MTKYMGDTRQAKFIVVLHDVMMRKKAETKLEAILKDSQCEFREGRCTWDLISTSDSYFSL